MSDTELLRAPPHSIEAEQSLLGALLIDNQAYDRIAFVQPAHFYRQDHRLIFEAMKELIERGRPADVMLTAEHLESRGALEQCGGWAYIGSLAQNTPSAFNIRRYAELVREKWILRTVQTKASEFVDKAWASGIDPRELAEEAGAAFLSIEIDQAPAEMVAFGAAMVEALEWADNPAKGLPSGLHDLDEKMGLLMPGDFIVIAGRPSMGKTALAMNIAEHISRSGTVAVFSLEMTRRKIAGRALKYHEAILGRDAAVDHLSELKLHIDDTPSVSLGHLRLRLRRLKRKAGLVLIVIDYLQLLRAPNTENRTQEVSELSRGLKSIAKEFDVPLVAVAQLNRGAEGRTDRRPMLSDLRESGQIEQDADIIAFVYREEYYNADTPWKGIAEVLVRKHRDGATGTAYLKFIPEYTRFKPMDGPLPLRDPPAAAKVSSFADFKTKAAGE